MNVLLVSHSPELGGAERCLIDLAVGLKGRGIPMVVVCPEAGPMTRTLSELGIPFVVRSMRRPRRQPHRMLELVLMWVPTILQLATLMRVQRTTVVYNNTVDALYAPFAAALLGIPCVWHIHEVRPDPEWARGIMSRMFRLLATRVVFNSASTLEAFAGRGSRPTSWSVVYNGVSAPAASPPHEAKDDRLVAGFAGDMRPHKRPELFIEALALARRRVPALQGSIAGDGMLLPAVQETARRLGLDEAVVFWGRVFEMGRFYAGLDMRVLTSQREGFGQVLVEAMALGVPVVAAAVGGVPEAIEDGVSGYLVPTGDAAAFAQRMTELASDPALRRRMGEAGRRHVSERFTLKRYREQLINQLQLAARR